MTVFAYIRVSTDKNQTTDNQRKIITDAGFAVDEYVSEDGVSGSIDALQRPGFAYLMSRAKSGDTVICTMLDRIGRNTIDTLTTVREFKNRGVKLRILQLDGIDLTGTAGKLLVAMLATLAEMERDLIIERTKAGLERTKAQGTKLGAPLTIKPEVLSQMIVRKDEGASLDKLVKEFGIPRNTIARNLRKWGGDVEGYSAEWNARESQYALKAS